MLTHASLPSALRNGRRHELLYLAGSHSLVPDVCEVADATQGQDEQAKLAAARPIDPEASGLRVAWWPCNTLDLQWRL
jgi:hypothetical protein